jgi:hypothetical protein
MALLYIMNGRLTACETELRQTRGGVTTTKRRAITIKEAAGESGFSESGVKVRIRQGRITARKLGGHWVDDAASVARRVR